VTEHLSAPQIERYRKKALSAEELLDLGDHVALCEACRSRVSEAVGLSLSVGSLRADFESSTFTHITYEQIAAYVDDKIDPIDREAVDSHLARCPQCSKEVRELREISAQLPSLSFVEPIAISDKGHAQKTKAPWERVLGLRRMPWSIPIQIAAAVAVIALLVWTVTLPLRREIRDLKAQLTETEEKNEQLQQEYEIAKAETEDLQTQLQAANRVQTGPQTETDIALNDGPLRVRVDNRVEGLESLSPTYQQAIRNAIETGQVKTPQTIIELAREADVLMGPSNQGVAFALYSPVGTVIRTARPTFRWQAIDGAASYSVTVFDTEYNEVARSSALTTPSWTMPNGLERGRAYLWKVTATKNGNEIKSPVPPAPEARFRVLEKNRLDEISRARNDYPNSHLLGGLVYAQAGLLEESEREFQLLARSNPKSSLAQKLLRAVRSLRR
jgi:hypothetical protein